MFTVAILTISDKGYQGIRPDISSDVIREVLAQLDTRVIDFAIVPDEKEMITEKLITWADGGTVDVIITTGGTGLSPRDITPEATLSVIDRLVPGIAEVMRAESLKKTPHGMLSRGVSGMRKKSLIINLPGSPKAVRECLAPVLPALPHAVEIIKGQGEDTHAKPA
jgi:molybdopterin adenylyltransferase